MKYLRWAWVLVVAALLVARAAEARQRVYVIAIGNNAPPMEAEGADPLPQLRYADDDAAAFASFANELGAHASLLTILDEESQARHHDLTSTARPPSLAELRLMLARHNVLFDRDRANGDEPVLLFFYSGHGTLAGPAPSLTLLDGPLTQAVLYDEVLSQLHAAYVHLIVDACHAEAVVRPRDLKAEVSPMTQGENRAYVAAKTLAQFPTVGAIIATATAAQAHEWDGFRGGVFTHEVLSGLRGAADVNRDGIVEYSELYAFLSAANREVADSRARLSVVVHVPPVNPHAPLSDLSGAHGAKLTSGTGSVGQLTVEDERGNRLVDLHSESGFPFSLTIPYGRRLYVRSSSGERSLRAASGEVVALETLREEKEGLVARGAMASALQRGLFASPFGPVYYRGFVDGHPDLPPVEERTESAEKEAKRQASPPRTASWIAFGTAAVLGISSGALAVASLRDKRDYEGTSLERPAADAHDRFIVHRGWGVATGIGALVSAGLGYWLWPKGSLPDGARAVVTSSDGGPGFAVSGDF
jgi:hypothetical protein